MIGTMPGKQAVAVILGVSALLGSHAVLLEAAAQTPKSVIDGTEITPQEAEVRTTSRIRPVIVLDINTSELEIVFVDLETKISYRTRLRASLLDGDDRHKLFRSLEERSEIWVEVALQGSKGNIRFMEVLRTTDPPNSK